MATSVSEYKANAGRTWKGKRAMVMTELIWLDSAVSSAAFGDLARRLLSARDA
jgi:hypothetical protein